MKRDFLKPIVKRCAWALLAGVMVINSVILGDERDESSESRSIGGAAAVTGQAEGVDYSAILYDESNGLPTSDANTVYATSDGFIWIGGYSGLIRYDGTNFSRHSSSGGVANVNALYEDHLG
ncbi:MAG: two-component regulator propeller domain-containing protein, partial [Acutalibacteraceae bacterium]|nr:two-component regulator propeller domain-containing protein [Acutalibacteraceae bacterium]